MRTTEISCPEPSLFAWSRTARPVRLVTPVRRPAAPSRSRPGGVDDALFASAAVALIATLLIAIVAV
jgi:hypothetical protein